MRDVLPHLIQINPIVLVSQDAIELAVIDGERERWCTAEDRAGEGADRYALVPVKPAKN